MFIPHFAHCFAETRMRRLSTEIKGRLPLAIVIMDFCTKCTNAVSLSRALCYVMESLFLNYSKRLCCAQRIFSTDRDVTTIRHIILSDQTRSKRRDLHSTDSKIKKNLYLLNYPRLGPKRDGARLNQKGLLFNQGFPNKNFPSQLSTDDKTPKGKNHRKQS